MGYDLSFHAAQLLVLAGVGWRVVVAVNRLAGVLKDFPPHRHINGSVVYPDGFVPTAVQKLKAET